MLHQSNLICHKSFRFCESTKNKKNIFGSVLTDHFNEQSDVDFLVNIEEGARSVQAGGHLWDLYDELKSLLNRDVDLLTERSLKNPYFMQEISPN